MINKFFEYIAARGYYGGVRPDSLDDVLELWRYPKYGNGWYKWTDLNNRTYENLVIRKYADASEENQERWGRWDETKPPKELLESELKKMQDLHDSYQYARDRQEEYPSWEKQLDHIFHHGIDAWKTDMVQPIKDKYPKS